MKNRLVTDATRKDYKLSQGHEFPEFRHSGRSTGMALKFIGEAMLNPGEEIALSDHYSDKRSASTLMGDLIKDMIFCLKLEFLTVRDISSYCFIKYEVFEEET